MADSRGERIRADLAGSIESRIAIQQTIKLRIHREIVNRNRHAVNFASPTFIESRRTIWATTLPPIPEIRPDRVRVESEAGRDSPGNHSHGRTSVQEQVGLERAI